MVRLVLQPHISSRYALSIDFFSVSYSLDFDLAKSSIDNIDHAVISNSYSVG